MSFVAKAVKKVFKGVKKVVSKAVSFTKRLFKNKWFRIAVVIAATVFTAGIASAGGFAAFSGVNSIGGFMSAVGSTMSTGWSAIVGGLQSFGAKVGSALSGGTSTAATTAASGANIAAGGQSMMLAANNAASLPGMVGGAAAGASGAAAAAAAGSVGGTLGTAGLGSIGIVGSAANLTATTAAGGGIVKSFLSKAGNLLMDPGLAGTALRSGIMMGIGGYLRGKEAEKQEEYFRNRTVWGGPAFGGSSDPIGLLFPSSGEEAAAQQQAQQQMGAPTQFDPQAYAGQTNYAEIADQPQNVQGPVPTPEEQGLLFAGAQEAPQQVQPPPTQPRQQYQRPMGGISPELLGVT
jgi:hypothetical protein